MKAKIDIQTPAGKSLDGYPVVIDGLPNETDELFGSREELTQLYYNTKNVVLNPGDKITIEILP